MYMIEISEDRLHTMAEHAERGIKHIGRLIQCISDLEYEYSSEGAYGDRGRLRNESEDEFDEDTRDPGYRSRKHTRRY